MINCHSQIISTHSLTKRLTITAFRQRTLKNYFNSQPHEEADTVQNGGITITDISTHSLTKRLTFLDILPKQIRSISTHSLTKRLTIFSQLPLFGINISTHSLTKRLTKNRVYSYWFQVDFNSQPHEEADLERSNSMLTRNISTHSLTKRLTRLLLPCRNMDFISTHSLTKRLTMIDLTGKSVFVFQLTASRRG